MQPLMRLPIPAWQRTVRYLEPQWGRSKLTIEESYDLS